MQKMCSRIQLNSGGTLTTIMRKMVPPLDLMAKKQTESNQYAANQKSDRPAGK